MDNLTKDGSNWLDFCTKIKSHVQASDPELADLLEDAELTHKAVDLDLMADAQGIGSGHLQHTLTMLTRGVHPKLVRGQKIRMESKASPNWPSNVTQRAIHQN